jgi:hypothetical protein
MRIFFNQYKKLVMAVESLETTVSCAERLAELETTNSSKVQLTDQLSTPYSSCEMGRPLGNFKMRAAVE